MKDIMKKIDKQKINKKYDLHFDDLKEIVNSSESNLTTFYHCFVYGYIQGQRAILFENKKS